MDAENSSSSNDAYRECLRNHAASLGSYATDGCGEFTPDDTSSPNALQCVACGCHRNFHRRVTYTPRSSLSTPTSAPHHHRVIMSHDVMTSQEMVTVDNQDSGSHGRKRFRSKFTVEQKERMKEFAEKLGWKLQRNDLEDEIERFCRSVGVSRQVFKVWMHNHMNLSSSSSASASTNANASSLTTQ